MLRFGVNDKKEYEGFLALKIDYAESAALAAARRTVW